MDEMCVRERLSTYMEQVRPDVEEYFDALDQLVGYASSLRGQTTILAVTHGLSYRPGYEFMEALTAVFGFNPAVSRQQGPVLARNASLRTRVERLLAGAVRRNVVLYVLDRSTAPMNRGAEQGGYWEPGAQPYQVGYLQASQDLGQLALETGGTLLRGHDVRESASRALDLERGRYLLGIYVDEWLDASQLRRIDVDAPRGVEIRRGRGQYADAAAEPVFEQGIELRPGARSAARADAVVVPFVLRFDRDRLGYRRSGERYRAGLGLHVVAETAAGDRLAEVYHFFTHELEAEAFGADADGTLTLVGAIEVPAGDYRLSATVRNAMSGGGGQAVADLRIEAVPRGGSTPGH